MKNRITIIECIVLILALLIGFYGCQQFWATNTVSGQIIAVIGFVVIFILTILNIEKLYKT